MAVGAEEDDTDDKDAARNELLPLELTPSERSSHLAQGRRWSSMSARSSGPPPAPPFLGKHTVKDSFMAFQNTRGPRDSNLRASDPELMLTLEGTPSTPSPTREGARSEAS